MPPTAAPAAAPAATTGSTAGPASRTPRPRPRTDVDHAAPSDTNALAPEAGTDDEHHDSDDASAPEPPDNDDPEPPPGYQTLLWPTSSLTLTEAIADLKKGLAQLQPSSTTSSTARTSTASPTSFAATGVGSDMSSNAVIGVVRTPLGQVSVTARRVSPHEDMVDTMSRGPLTTRADDAAVDTSLFRVPPRFAMPVSPPSTSTTRTMEDRRVQQAGPRSSSALPNSLTARRLVQLTGPAGSGAYQTAPGNLLAWSLDGVVRPHGVAAPVGPGAGGAGGTGGAGGAGALNFTGLGLGRGGGSVTGTLAGSLHGGVNVLLGG